MAAASLVGGPHALKRHRRRVGPRGGAVEVLHEVVVLLQAARRAAVTDETDQNRRHHAEVRSRGRSAPACARARATVALASATGSAPFRAAPIVEGRSDARPARPGRIAAHDDRIGQAQRRPLAHGPLSAGLARSRRARSRADRARPAGEAGWSAVAPRTLRIPHRARRIDADSDRGAVEFNRASAARGSARSGGSRRRLELSSIRPPGSFVGYGTVSYGHVEESYGAGEVAGLLQPANVGPRPFGDVMTSGRRASQRSPRSREIRTVLPSPQTSAPCSPFPSGIASSQRAMGPSRTSCHAGADDSRGGARLRPRSPGARDRPSAARLRTRAVERRHPVMSFS